MTSDPFAVRAGLAEIAQLPPVACLTANQRGTVEVVLAEVLNNIAEHAYGGGTGTINLTVQTCAVGLACRVIDTGFPMPGGQLPAGNHPLPQTDTGAMAERPALDDLPEGGFGWYIIRTLTQNLTYTRIGSQNRLDFVIAL